MELERETFRVETSENPEDIKTIHKNLVQYVEEFVGPSTLKELTLTIKSSSGDLIGGLNGQSNWQWLFVKMVWVKQDYRYKGLGSKLLQAAEQEARRRNLAGVWLDTFSFQSPDFYKKHGYAEFGKIDNYPFGHTRHYFFKRF